MKTLHQLLSLRNKRTGYLLRWQELNNLSYCGIPPTFTVTATHGTYCVWHESCYKSHRAFTQPVCSPKRRKPYHSSEPRACICLYENFGTKHHAFKKHSSRVLRRAFKRDDLHNWQEDYEDYCFDQEFCAARKTYYEYAATYQAELEQWNKKIDRERMHRDIFLTDIEHSINTNT